jgi:hypothetical protein
MFMNLVGKKTSCLVMYTHIVFNNIDVFAWIETLEVHIVLKKYSLVYVKGVPDEIQPPFFASRSNFSYLNARSTVKAFLRPQRCPRGNEVLCDVTEALMSLS